MFYDIVSSLKESLQMHLVMNGLGFTKIIMVRLIIYYLIKLKYGYLRPLKNNSMLIQN